MSKNFLLSGTKLVMSETEAEKWRAMLDAQANVTIAGCTIVVVRDDEDAVRTALGIAVSKPRPSES